MASRPARSSTNCRAVRPDRLERRSAQRRAASFTSSGGVRRSASLRVVVDDREIGALVETVEAEYESEAIGKCQFFVDRFAELELSSFVEAHRLVVRRSLGEQVSPVARRDDANVLRWGDEAPLEGRLQFSVLRLAALERKVVAEQDEAVGRFCPVRPTPREGERDRTCGPRRSAAPASRSDSADP